MTCKGILFHRAFERQWDLALIKLQGDFEGNFVTLEAQAVQRDITITETVSAALGIVDF